MADYRSSTLPLRKKMRKGTKSCAECRRRKLKCTYGDGNVTCVPCLARGSKCVTQQYAASSISSSASPPSEDSSLELRVKILEKRLQEALQRPDSCKESSVLANVPLLANELEIATLDSELESVKHKSPGGLGFSHNAFASGDTPTDTVGPRALRNYRAIEILRSMLPCLDVLRDFCKSLEQKWACMQRAMPNFYLPASSSVGDYMMDILESYDSDLYQVGKVVSLVALGLNQLDNTLTLGFNGNIAELSLQYAKVVEKLITADDELSSRVDAVEIMFMLVVYYTDVGRPRKAWIMNGRAIRFAQLLGVDQCLVLQKDRNEQHRQYALWLSMCIEERKMGLLMGLPAVTLDFKFDKDNDPAIVELSFAQKYFLDVMDIAGQILRRDRATTMSFSETLRIDQEIAKLAERKLANVPDSAQRQDEDFLDFAERFMVWSLHYLMRVLLHLPFLLKPGSDERFGYSRSTGLECARSLLTCYLQFYWRASLLTFRCRTLDFQAFIAAMALLVNLIDENSDRSNEERDWELVNSCIDTLRNSGDVPGDMVGMQAANALETVKQAYNEETGRVVTVDVPFFGRITIKCNAASRLKGSPLTDSPGLPDLTNTSSADDFSQPLTASQEEQAWAQVYWNANRFDNSLALPSLQGMSNLASLQFEFDLNQDWNMLGADELMVHS